MVGKTKKKAARKMEKEEREEEQAQVQVQKALKVKSKSLFTRKQHQLIDLLKEEEVKYEQVKVVKIQLLEAHEQVIDHLAHLLDLYTVLHDDENLSKMNKEWDKVEEEFDTIQNRLEEYLESREETSSVAASTPSKKQEMDHSTKDEGLDEAAGQTKMKNLRDESMERDMNIGTPTVYSAMEGSGEEIGCDMWKLLTRVSIPIFNGDKRSYGGWTAAFMVCVDKAPATAEYKLLQLKKYLSGEALRAVESLGHSATAYEAAKERLERKYGEQTRQVNLYIEELDNFRPIRPGNARDVDKLADLLDVLVINLKKTGRGEELGNGSLYIKVQKKLTEVMLANYNRWVFEHNKSECVETLHQWIIKEAEFQTVAAETLKGLGSRQKDSHSFFGQSQEDGRRGQAVCQLCKTKNHPLWFCNEFKQKSPAERWHVAKCLSSCY